ncbi:MAG: hypothetical protein ACOC78_03295, partial [Actinomycetota bacterium]
MGDKMEVKAHRGEDRSRLKRGLILGITLSAAALVIISLLTLDRETFEALSNLSPFYLILAAGLSLGRWIWSGIRMKLLVASTGKAIP